MRSSAHQLVSRRRLVLGGVAAVALAGAGTPGVRASTTSDIRQLRMLIPANEGGGWDQTGRALGAALLASGTVRDVVYENVGGKGGTVGLARYVELYDKQPDTLLVGGIVMVGALALNRQPVNLSNVTPVARLTSEYSVLAVRADSPIKTPKDLVERLRAEPEKTPIAGGSAGGIDHMLAGMLARVAGRVADLVYLPFAGGVEVVDALMSGKAVAAVSGHSEFSGGLASGRLRAIGVSSRQPFLGIPSIKGQGVDVDIANWRGVFTGKGVPPDRHEALLGAVRKAVATPEWTSALKRNNWDAVWQEGKAFQDFIQFEGYMADVLVQLLKLRKGGGT